MSETERRILKWTVPVDDQWHPIGGGNVVLVACPESSQRVMVWTDETGRRPRPVPARVFATGQPLPSDDKAVHVGSVVTNVGLVWHVLTTRPPR